METRHKKNYNVPWVPTYDGSSGKNIFWFLNLKGRTFNFFCVLRKLHSISILANSYRHLALHLTDRYCHSVRFLNDLLTVKHVGTHTNPQKNWIPKTTRKHKAAFQKTNDKQRPKRGSNVSVARRVVGPAGGQCAGGWTWRRRTCAGGGRSRLPPAWPPGGAPRLTLVQRAVRVGGPAPGDTGAVRQINT